MADGSKTGYPKGLVGLAGELYYQDYPDGAKKNTWVQTRYQYLALALVEFYKTDKTKIAKITSRGKTISIGLFDYRLGAFWKFKPIKEFIENELFNFLIDGSPDQNVTARTPNWTGDINASFLNQVRGHFLKLLEPIEITEFNKSKSVFAFADNWLLDLDADLKIRKVEESDAQHFITRFINIKIENNANQVNNLIFDRTASISKTLGLELNVDNLPHEWLVAGTKKLTDLTDEDRQRIKAFYQIFAGVFFGNKVETILYLYGDRDGGKSEHFLLLTDIFGEFTGAIDTRILFSTTRNITPDQLAKTLEPIEDQPIIELSTETKQEFIINEHAKTLTGGHKITTRKLYQQATNQQTRRLIIGFGNHLPANIDNPIKKRLEIAHHENTFADSLEQGNYKINAQLEDQLKTNPVKLGYFVFILREIVELYDKQNQRRQKNPSFKKLVIQNEKSLAADIIDWICRLGTLEKTKPNYFNFFRKGNTTRQLKKKINTEFLEEMEPETKAGVLVRQPPLARRISLGNYLRNIGLELGKEVKPHDFKIKTGISSHQRHKWKTKLGTDKFKALISKLKKEIKND